MIILKFTSCFNDDFICPNGKSALENHEFTMERIRQIEKKGYVVFPKWECEVKKEMEINGEMKEFFKQSQIKVYKFKNLINICLTQNIFSLKSYFLHKNFSIKLHFFHKLLTTCMFVLI